MMFCGKIMSDETKHEADKYQFYLKLSIPDKYQ